jgi:hypothetical protein
MIHRKRMSTLIIIAAIGLFSSIASAADNWQWYECSVLKVGVGGGRYEFQLSGTNMYSGSPGSISAWYEIHPGSTQLEKEILAIVLASVSLGKKVQVLLIPELTQSIYAIYLVM